MTKRNPIAKVLRTPRFKLRVKRSKRVYDRKRAKRARHD
jgi:hypothetical protein